jgi:hypothetical protein
MIALTRLANPPQPRVIEPDEEREWHSPTSSALSPIGDDARSRLTPGPAAKAALGCLHDLFVGVGITDLGLIETSDLSRPSDGSMPSDASIDRPDIDRLEDTEAANKKLILACNAGDLAKVQACIAMGANANATDLYGQTALILAARAGHKSTVEFLADHGANVNAINRHSRRR